MDYHSLPRKDLQLLCKKHGIPANKTNVFMAEALAKKRVPLSDVNVNKEADNDLFQVTPSKVSAAKSKGENGNAVLFNNTPFLRRGNKKKESVTSRASDGPEEEKEKEEGATAPSRGARLFEQAESDPILETATIVGAVGQNPSAKESSGTLKREESKSGKLGATAKCVIGPVRQKSEEKTGLSLRSASGQFPQTESRRGRSVSSANLTKAANEKTEVKPFDSSAAASTGALQPDGSRTWVCDIPAIPGETAVKEKSGGKNPLSVRTWDSDALEQGGSESRSSGTSLKEVSVSSSDGALKSANVEEERIPETVDNSGEEASSVDAGNEEMGEDTNIEYEQQEGSESERPDTPPKQRYIVKVTFGENVAIDQGSAFEKARLEETKAKRLDTSATNVGYSVKSRWDSNPATSQPFVFGATRQEETKPKRSKTAARGSSDVKWHAESKPSVAGALKQDENKTRRSAPEVKEAAVVKVKPDAHASAVSSSYSKPSKRPRLGVGAKAIDSKGTGDRIPSAPSESEVIQNTPEITATSSEEFKVLDLPEWAKEFKRKREDTLSSMSPVAPTPDRPAKGENAVTPAAGLSPLKRIEDRVVKLLDRLKGFCWKAEIADIIPETEAAYNAVFPAEEADHIEVEYTDFQQGERTD
ncbi:hypothetical protein Mapa_010784 [Marchantia paleacea]|nr:hypothetical protein Mapa_010784 [Marchantia paleacea]